MKLTSSQHDLIAGLTDILRQFGATAATVTIPGAVLSFRDGVVQVGDVPAAVPVRDDKRRK